MVRLGRVERPLNALSTHSLCQLGYRRLMRPSSLKLRRASCFALIGSESPAKRASAKQDGAWGRFRAHLSAFSAQRFHQISFPGELVRTRRIELLSPEWRSGIEPINYIRVVRPRGFEPLVGRPACFKDAGFTDRWQERDAYVVRARMAEGEGVEPSTVRSARFSGPVACHHAPPSVIRHQ